MYRGISRSWKETRRRNGDNKRGRNKRGNKRGRKQTGTDHVFRSVACPPLPESIELALKSGQLFEPQSVQALADGLSVVALSQASLVPAATAEPMQTAMSQEEVKSVFAGLLTAVADNNPEALDIAQRLLDGLGEGAHGFEQLHAAHEALDMFDFASAQAHLQEAAEVFAT